MGWKEEVSVYFHFTKRDRLAIIIILFLMGFVWLLPRLVNSSSTPAGELADTSWIAAVKKNERKKDAEKESDFKRPAREYSSYSSAGKKEFRLFFFDPNTANADEWEDLGLRPKTIAMILNFRNKGGKFREVEDLRKIYGLFPDEYDRIAPYVRIAGDRSANGEPTRLPPKTAQANSPRLSVVDINLADTAAFVALPGIGSKLAARIISFREKLGGFYRVEQVAETFGLADSVFQKIRPYLVVQHASLKKINVNTATVDELKAHPYIRYQLAGPIIAYRTLHGSFGKVEDIKKVMGVTLETFEKVVAYLTVE